jgi:hypothetical protein
MRQIGHLTFGVATRCLERPIRPERTDDRAIKMSFGIARIVQIGLIEDHGGRDDDPSGIVHEVIVAFGAPA